MDRNEFLAAARRLARRIDDGPAPARPQDEASVKLRAERRNRFGKHFPEHREDESPVEQTVARA